MTYARCCALLQPCLVTLYGVVNWDCNTLFICQIFSIIAYLRTSSYSGCINLQSFILNCDDSGLSLDAHNVSHKYLALPNLNSNKEHQSQLWFGSLGFVWHAVAHNAQCLWRGGNRECKKMWRSEMFCTTMDATIQHIGTNLRNVHFKSTPHPAMIINIMLAGVTLQPIWWDRNGRESADRNISISPIPLLLVCL